MTVRLKDETVFMLKQAVLEKKGLYVSTTADVIIRAFLKPDELTSTDKANLEDVRPRKKVKDAKVK